MDGTNLCDLFLSQVRRHVAVVEQSPFIFHATVAENVRYARPEATDADVQQAIQAAGLSDLMDSMPEDINTVVGERGSQLSAGERQRVAIARAEELKDVLIRRHLCLPFPPLLPTPWRISPGSPRRRSG